jgi:SAM-dependent methyltransferase
MTSEMLGVARRSSSVVAAEIGYGNVEFVRGRIQDLALDAECLDVVVSNCVLNLVPPADRPRLFTEIHRVLRPDGRAVISDIVSDKPVPRELQENAELWSGCISGAFAEDDFLAAFREAGFDGTRIRERQAAPWRTVHGIEFRSMTVEACKGEKGALPEAGPRLDGPPCCGPGSCC